jgi:hypothetical protein
MKNHLKSLLALALLVSIWSSCGDGNPAFQVPSNYDFQPALWTGQIQRRAMLAEMTSYMKSANTMGVTLDAAVLKNMFANNAEPFADADLNVSGKQLENKCFELDQAMFQDYMDRIALASTSTFAGSNGVAGVVSSGSKSYLCDENGIEYTQLIEKGLMGAVFYYQATDVYLGADRMSADNITVDDQKGTDMEHHWDEAWGYTAFPIDFSSAWPESRNAELTFWAKYSNGRDFLLNSNELLATAFRTGRAAIGANDLEARDQQIATIREEWEKVVAGTAIHYINGGLANYGDDAIRNHELSEAIAFTMCLKYNPERKISIEQISEVLDLIGDNLYEVTTSDLNAAKDLLRGIYEFDQTIADAL